MRPSRRVAVLRLSGVIGAGGRFSRGLEDVALAPLVERAFATPRLAAVALAINSPGGAPAQSALIAQRIRDAANEKGAPVFAFCEDVAASGGYMLACAADEIWAEENSVVGSIGVVSASFGFHQAIDRLGVERRLQTAGAAKARLDPFLPEKPEDKVWLGALQERIHENFIALVKASRGDRLGGDPALFSGEVWLGAEAASLGLTDGVGRLQPVMRERFGDDVQFVPITPRKGLFASWFGGPGAGADVRDAASAGLSAVTPDALVEAALNEIERRAAWGRFGL